MRRCCRDEARAVTAEPVVGEGTAEEGRERRESVAREGTAEDSREKGRRRRVVREGNPSREKGIPPRHPIADRERDQCSTRFHQDAEWFRAPPDHELDRSDRMHTAPDAAPHHGLDHSDTYLVHQEPLLRLVRRRDEVARVVLPRHHAPLGALVVEVRRLLEPPHAQHAELGALRQVLRHDAPARERRRARGLARGVRRGLAPDAHGLGDDDGVGGGGGGRWGRRGRSGARRRVTHVVVKRRDPSTTTRQRVTTGETKRRKETPTSRPKTWSIGRSSTSGSATDRARPLLSVVKR